MGFLRSGCGVKYLWPGWASGVISLSSRVLGRLIVLSSLAVEKKTCDYMIFVLESAKTMLLIRVAF